MAAVQISSHGPWKQGVGTGIMAELLADTAWNEPDSLAAGLRDTLSDDYIVVEGASANGAGLGVVVVGPQGLFVLHARNWAGEVKPVWGGQWQVTLPSGQHGSYPNPALEAQRDTPALATFVRDELHGQEQPSIHHLLVLTNPQASLTPGVAPDIMVTTPANLPHVIATMPPSAGGLSDPAERSALAHGLLAHKLSATQRASQPFIFRSGGRLGSGNKVWTVQAAVQHMDRHPEDGIYHLNNGTLAAWLQSQGATDLAETARLAIRRPENDPRVALERFLLATGVVQRPAMQVRPKPVNLGCVISGGSCNARVQIRKGAGRGYLFGAITTSEPWLRVEPRSFHGGPVDLTVTVDTSSLPISDAAWHANLLIDSNAAPQPVPIPVRIRVSGEPSGLNRYGLRPLSSAAAAGLCGGLIGALLGAVGGLGAPAAVNSPALFWALVIGGLWAAFGLVRGLGQRPAWTASYALVRYLTKIGLWALGLVTAAALGLLVWNLLSGQEGPALMSNAGLRLALLAAAMAIAPATASEIRAARRASDSPLSGERRSLLQPALVAVAGIALVAVLAAGVRLAGPTWTQLTETGTVDSVQDWLDARWNELDATMRDISDKIYLWRYDRRTEP